MSKKKRLNMQKPSKCTNCGAVSESLRQVPESELWDPEEMGARAAAGDLEAFAILYFGAMFGVLEELTDELAAELVEADENITPDVIAFMRQEGCLYSRERHSFVKRDFNPVVGVVEFR